MNNKRWFKVSCYDSDGSVHFHSYQFADSSAEARAAALCWGLSEVKEVPESDVPTTLRVMKEASTEQLKSELKARGWSVTLS